MKLKKVFIGTVASLNTWLSEQVIASRLGVENYCNYTKVG